MHRSITADSEQRAAELISVRSFCKDGGFHPGTFWRWRKRGWIAEPLNLAGRLYLTREQIADFKRRAAAGEFAKSSPLAAKQAPEQRG